jgi:hypothetical protein
MISLKNGYPIATIEKHKNKFVYFKEASKDAEPELDTTKENKIKIFRKFLMRDDKLKKTEIEDLTNNYKNDVIELDSKKDKIYQKAIDNVNISLKRHLDFGNEFSVFPIINEPSYRLAIFGLSGSGKSHFANEFFKKNMPKRKNAGIFLFSPVQDDSSLQIKNLIHIKLENYENEFKKPFELEDIPPGSICIFDDCDTYHKEYRDLYCDLRNTLLERGRHIGKDEKGKEIGISTIIIQHQALGGNRNRSDIVLRECQYYTLFPKYNVRDTQNLLKSYTSITNEKIKEILDIDNSRWVFIKKSVPSYYVSSHDIGLI